MGATRAYADYLLSPHLRLGAVNNEIGFAEPLLLLAQGEPDRRLSGSLFFAVATEDWTSRFQPPV